ncbi:hypothetical protein CAOG_02348 [Capsaspora owczarzaki ATCC 30864]|uniref:hypothetical protein n=1 Tax=Capsaspora owczarzaki (strain ATCC 30864) TaxID=595528 RepID=UPI00035219B3|nr:hypothetical protein CAOG_02348 [Capsaspora owczarzaki ATCC 30864]|eukprot:XP_004349098.2 hypothetical protein CAOG_02348 [Capsaspora owczarzaki ATCC 30864]
MAMSHSSGASSTAAASTPGAAQAGTKPAQAGRKSSGAGVVQNGSTEGSKHKSADTAAMSSLASFMSQPFTRPPEAPVFRPTEEEFSDCLAYIASIREEAEKYGICKIIPPANWKPPFAIDLDKFVFPTRKQQLNELDGTSRVRRNFLAMITKYWSLQGSPLQSMPMIGTQKVDLYTLRNIVKRWGGLQAVTYGRRWDELATVMGLASEGQRPTPGESLRSVYEAIVNPFDIFDTHVLKSGNKQANGASNNSGGRMSGGRMSGGRMGGGRMSHESSTESLDSAGRIDALLRQEGSLETPASPKPAPPVPAEHPPPGDVCEVCLRPDDESKIILCDSCDHGYHVYCLHPPLPRVPDGDWYCPLCMKKQMEETIQPYGFDQNTPISLGKFKVIADKFKISRFGSLDVPSEVVEQEFWKLVSDFDHSVTVQYGSDLHSNIYGSGFPHKDRPETCKGVDPSYVHSGWNMNNVAFQQRSLLAYFQNAIVGMMVPWCYVGMCFSSFCWHYEDHWAYSINYNHWGAPKTWYGIAGSDADLFEETMRAAVPELFDQNPNLLYSLVTLLSPSVLMKCGVRVCRTDQHAGEFVVTFPAAYHAGFNHGLNFAEAVNFLLADWIPMGARCLERYRLDRHTPVLAFEELIFKAARSASQLDEQTAIQVHNASKLIFEKEIELRQQIERDYPGIKTVKGVLFEKIPDDDRTCFVCNALCFNSSLQCACGLPTRMTCLQHASELCRKCAASDRSLNIRFDPSEMDSVLNLLLSQLEYYQTWVTSTRELLARTSQPDNHPTLEELEHQLTSAAGMSPQHPEMQQLQATVSKARRLVSHHQLVLAPRQRTSRREAQPATNPSLTGSIVVTSTPLTASARTSLVSSSDLANWKTDVETIGVQLHFDSSAMNQVVQNHLDRQQKILSIAYASLQLLKQPGSTSPLETAIVDRINKIIPDGLNNAKLFGSSSNNDMRRSKHEILLTASSVLCRRFDDTCIAEFESFHPTVATLPADAADAASESEGGSFLPSLDFVVDHFLPDLYVFYTWASDFPVAIDDIVLLEEVIGLVQWFVDMRTLLMNYSIPYPALSALLTKDPRAARNQRLLETIETLLISPAARRVCEVAERLRAECRQLLPALPASLVHATSTAAAAAVDTDAAATQGLKRSASDNNGPDGLSSNGDAVARLSAPLHSYNQLPANTIFPTSDATTSSPVSAGPLSRTSKPHVVEARRDLLHEQRAQQEAYYQAKRQAKMEALRAEAVANGTLPDLAALQRCVDRVARHRLKLEESEQLQDCIRKARAWTTAHTNATRDAFHAAIIPGLDFGSEAQKQLEETYQLTTRARTAPSIIIAQELLSRANDLFVVLPGLEFWEGKMEASANWLRRVVDAFVRPPEAEAEAYRRRPVFEVASELAAIMWSPARSLQEVLALRERNEVEDRTEVCVCKTRMRGIMSCCEVCSDWFHNACMGLPINMQSNVRFLCPKCCRTARPSLSVAMSLLDEYKANIPLYIPLADIIGREILPTLRWQEHATSLLFRLGARDLASENQLDELEARLIEGDLLELTTPEYSQIILVAHQVELALSQERFVDFSAVPHVPEAAVVAKPSKRPLSDPEEPPRPSSTIKRSRAEVVASASERVPAIVPVANETIPDFEERPVSETEMEVESDGDPNEAQDPHEAQASTPPHQAEDLLEEMRKAAPELDDNELRRIANTVKRNRGRPRKFPATPESARRYLIRKARLQGAQVRELANRETWRQERIALALRHKMVNEQAGVLPTQDGIQTYSTRNPARLTKQYCICRKPESGYMIRCIHCEEWFHGKCIGLDLRNSANINSYVCDECSRKASPQMRSFETISEAQKLKLKDSRPATPAAANSPVPGSTEPVLPAIRFIPSPKKQELAQSSSTTPQQHPPRPPPPPQPQAQPVALPAASQHRPTAAQAAQQHPPTHPSQRPPHPSPASQPMPYPPPPPMPMVPPMPVPPYGVPPAMPPVASAADPYAGYYGMQMPGYDAYAAQYYASLAAHSQHYPHYMMPPPASDPAAHASMYGGYYYPPAPPPAPAMPHPVIPPPPPPVVPGVAAPYYYPYPYYPPPM